MKLGNFLKQGFFLGCCVSLLVALPACKDQSNKKEDGSSPASSPPPDESTGKLAIATDFAEMELSKALASDVPAAMKAQGEEAATGAGTIAISTASLLGEARQRGTEGCEIRRSVKNGLNLIREMAQELCYIEAGAKALKPNGKYRATYDEGGAKGTYSVWIDDTTAGKRRVSLCGNDKLRYIFDLEAAKGGQAKGVVTTLNTDEAVADGEKWIVQAQFDIGVSRAGRTRLDIRGDYQTADGSSHERLFINFGAAGVSFVAEAKVGDRTLEDDSTEHWTTQSAALFARNLGSVLNRYATTPEGETAPTDSGAYRAFFDGKGQVLAAADSDAWRADGPLEVKPRLLPRLPSWSKFELPSDAWDCSGTTEVVPEGEEADYAKCDALQVDWEEEDCEDESLYTYSGESENIADDQVSQTDEIEFKDAE